GERRASRRRVGGVRIEAIRGLRQVQLLEEDVRELTVPVLAGVEHDLLDPRVAQRDAGIEEVVLHTGQHWDRELSDVFFEELDLPEPAYRLDPHTADPAATRPPLA